MAVIQQAEQPVASLESAQLAGRSRLAALARVAKAKPLGALSLLVLLIVVAMVLAAPLLTRYTWDDLFTGDSLASPSMAGAHYFGTDFSGRDIFARTLYGGRLTLATSLIATTGAVIFAALFGIVSGYFAGLYDLLFQRLADGLQALPGLVVLMVVVAAFNQSRVAILLVLILLQAPGGGRVLRSQTLALRNLAFVESAKATGANPLRVVMRHIVPNVFPLMIVIFSISVGVNMLLLTTLSFLGVLNPATPDWGGMLNTAAEQNLLTAPWTALFPGAAITISVLAFNLLGDAIRDVFDPRLRGS